jgi:hypothetical protein
MTFDASLLIVDGDLLVESVKSHQPWNDPVVNQNILVEEV